MSPQDFVVPKKGSAPITMAGTGFGLLSASGAVKLQVDNGSPFTIKVGFTCRFDRLRKLKIVNASGGQVTGQVVTGDAVILQMPT